MKVLITGGAGFVGSNIAFRLKELQLADDVIVLDNLVRRGSEINLNEFKRRDIKFLHADIRIESDLDEIPPVDFILDASADPSVLSGIHSSPAKVLQSNLFATANLLELASRNSANFIFLSTSRVYPFIPLASLPLIETNTRFELNSNIAREGVSARGISESYTLNGSRSFYGSAKLSSENLIQEYITFKGLKASVLRCGVIAGPGQFGKVDQGILVFWIASHFWKNKLRYIGFGGTGKQVRDFLHIADLFTLIQLHLKNFGLFSGKTFNVGGGLNNSMSLLELTNLCQEVTGNSLKIDSVSETRLADVPYYVTDSSLISNQAGWSPVKTNDQLVSDTFQWIKQNEAQLKFILS